MELILLFEIFLQNTTNQITNMTEFFQSIHFKSTPSPHSTNLPIFKQKLPIPSIQPFLGKLTNLLYKKYGSELWRLDTLSLVSHTTKRAIIIQSFYVSQKQRVFWNIFCFTFNINLQRYYVKIFVLLQKSYLENFQRKLKEIFPWVRRWKIEGKHLSIFYRLYLRTFEKLYLNGSNFYFICFQNCLQYWLTYQY